MRRTLGVKDLGAAMGQGRRTIMRWVAAGCPHDKAPGLRGRLTFNQDEVVAWMRDVGATGERGRPPEGAEIERAEEARARGRVEKDTGSGPGIGEIQRLTRLVNLKIKKLEAEKRKRVEEAAKGELIPREDVLRYWQTRCAALHSALRALPDRVARAGGEHYEKVHREAELAVEDALLPFKGSMPL